MGFPLGCENGLEKREKGKIIIIVIIIIMTKYLICELFNWFDDSTVSRT